MIRWILLSALLAIPAAVAVAGRPDADTLEALRAFDREFPQGDHGTRIRALNRLRDHPHPVVVAKLVETAEREIRGGANTPEAIAMRIAVTRRAVDILQRFPIPEAAEALCRLIGSGHEELRGFATSALEHLEGDARIWLIGNAFASRDVELQVRILHALGTMGDPAAVPTLVEGLGKRDARVQAAAARALAECGASDEAKELLRAKLRAADDPLRVQILLALGSTGDPELLPLLEESLTDDNWRIRSAAIEALARTGLNEAGLLLARHLGTADDREYDDTLAALKALSGEEHEGLGPEGWGRVFHNRIQGREEAVGEGNGGDAEATSLEFAPPTTFYGIPTRSRRIIFVVDKTGSMQGDKLATLKEELQTAIRSLAGDEARAEEEGYEAPGAEPRPPGWFTIVAFDTTVTIWKEELVEATPRNLREAERFIDGLAAAGATNIYDPMVRALAIAQGARTRRNEVDLDLYGEPSEENTGDTIFLLSDGAANNGRIIDPDEIVNELTRQNAALRVVIHTISIQAGGDLLRKLAERNGGSHVAR